MVHRGHGECFLSGDAVDDIVQSFLFRTTVADDKPDDFYLVVCDMDSSMCNPTIQS